eukprot:TRINITY_DN8660_c0_g2_i1.p1 TRINITY_DN8660_c0_g2~~TRINITY_DN8660_c0_g2_i1.p1  ORF type:complete len:122 (-),score=17.67 TRINITY_DN8660_c0_g2_i1:95-421(-)
MGNFLLIDMATGRNTFIRLVSGDDKEFFVEMRIAALCDTVLKQMNTSASDIQTVRFGTISGETLEGVIQYLHYKAKYMDEPNYQTIPEFYIEPRLSLDVLKAAIHLKL